MKLRIKILLSLLLLLLPLLLFAQEEVEILFDKAIENERQGNLDLALTNYFAIIEIDSEYTEALVRAAKILSWKSEYEEAITLLDKALALDPAMEEALFRKGQILSWMGNYHESISLFNTFLTIKPNDPDGLLALGRVLFWKGEYDSALESLNESLQNGADPREIGTEKAKVYLTMERNDLAKVELKEVLLFDPDYEEALRLYEGLEQIYKVEIVPLSGTLYVYPDESTSLMFDPTVIFHFKNRWDVILINKIQGINESWDNTIKIGTVYRGIDNLYLGLQVDYTPVSNFNPYLGLQASIHGSLGESFGTGLTLKGLFYDSPPLTDLGQDTLIEISPEISTHFGNMSFIKITGNWFQYTSGYNALRVSLATSVNYYKDNSISAAVSYGGSVDIMDSERRSLAMGAGIKQSISPLIDLSASYNYIDTLFGTTHQIGFNTLFHW